MTISGIIFYVLAVIILAATLLAVTRRNVMHAIVYLVVSFFAMAPLFYLLGAPLLALLEIIIYAGAIMVLFLFIVMMLKIEVTPVTAGRWLRQWLPAMAPERRLRRGDDFPDLAGAFPAGRAAAGHGHPPGPGPICLTSATGSPWKSPRCCSLWPWWGPTTWAAKGRS